MDSEQYDYSTDQHYQDTREALANTLDEFKQLERDEPEAAARLGFLGFATLQVMMNTGSVQVGLLRKIIGQTAPSKPDDAMRASAQA